MLDFHSKLRDASILACERCGRRKPGFMWPPTKVATTHPLVKSYLHSYDTASDFCRPCITFDKAGERESWDGFTYEYSDASCCPDCEKGIKFTAMNGMSIWPISITPDVQV